MGSTIDTFFPEIVDEWRAKGVEVVTASSTDSTVLPFTRIGSLSRGPTVRNFFAPQQIRNWVDTVQPDVVITNTATASAVARLSRLSVPVIYFCHGLHWNQGRSLSDQMWKLIETSLVNRTAGAITINQDDERWFSHRMRRDKVLRLHFGVGVPLETYPHAPVTPDGKVRLLWVGEFIERKQPSDAISVLRRLKSLGVDCSLTMLGEGPLLAAVRDQVANSKLSMDVMLPGRSDVRHYMHASTALLHTAKWEGLPRVMLESLACGRKTYAYDVKGVRDIPEVVLAPEGYPELLAEAIRDDTMPNGTPTELIFDRTLLDVRRTASEMHDYISSFIKSGV
nr:glycosyltransferase [Cryobacterium sp. N21]